MRGPLWTGDVAQKSAAKRQMEGDTLAGVEEGMIVFEV
jgi:hypothetical protein